MTITSNAPAKINLHLHITGRRSDGYHLLESIIAFTDIADTVSAALSDTLSLQVGGPMAPALSGHDNIVLKAARLLAQTAGIEPNASIMLEKQIPLGAGLGGGSADAAAALHSLNQLWRLNADNNALKRLALQLGADVPVFIERTAAFVSGIGEQLQPLPHFPALHAVLVNPLVPLSTPAVFKQGVTKFSPPEKFTSSEMLLAYAKRCRNDLEAPAIILAPVIKDILALIASQAECQIARMSGSGATCFGIFTTAAAATAAATAIKHSKPEWWVKETRVIGKF